MNNETLVELASRLAALTKAVQGAHGLSFEDTWNAPAVQQERDALVALLTDTDEIDNLLEASAELRKQHQKLAMKGDLTADELRQLGTLSGLAAVISAQALAKAMSAEAIFKYTVKVVRPWVERAVKLGIVVVGLV